MSIKLYTGLQGSGKSYEVVSVVILGALREGRRVVSNIAGLNYEAMRDLLISEGVSELRVGTLYQIHHDDVYKENFFRTDTDEKNGIETIIQPGDVVCIDEIWRFWETPKQVTPRTQNFFRMHRHMVHPDTNFACEIVLITQSVDDVIRKIRSVVETTYVMTKHIELGTDKHYRIDIYSRAITHRVMPINSYQKSYDPKYFGLYKSHSVAEEGVEAVEKSIGRKATIWNKPIIKFGMPLAVVFFCVSFFLLWRFFHPPEQSKKIEDAKAPGAPVAAKPAENFAPIVSDKWRVAGWYLDGATFTAILAGQGGVIRQLHAANYKFQGRDLQIQLPEGGFATAYGGAVENNNVGRMLK